MVVRVPWVTQQALSEPERAFGHSLIYSSPLRYDLRKMKKPDSMIRLPEKQELVLAFWKGLIIDKSKT